MSHPIPQTHPSIKNQTASGDIVLGSGVRLRSIRMIQHDLRDTGLTYRALKAWIRSLNIPIIHIGRDQYINPFYFQLALHAITRPGSPDFLVPGCYAITRKQTSRVKQQRELSADYFQENVHTFISEIISARRHDFKKDHRAYVQQTSKIVDHITLQYDLLRAPLAFTSHTKATRKETISHVQASSSPLLPVDNALRFDQSKDIDPTIAPLKPPKRKKP